MSKIKDLDTVSYFKPSEELVKILMQKTQNNNPLFFRILVSYYFSKVASMMRTEIRTHDRGDIPVNMYAMNLASSGHGKGFSTNIIEENVIHIFKEKFINQTFPLLAERNIAKLALQRLPKNPDMTEEEMIAALETEFAKQGNMVFAFDSGTTPAVKQMRHKLLMAGAGSVNFEMDEIGSNLMGNSDVLSTFLELYDVGKVKQKLTKHTNDNLRLEEIDGRTPTNMMLFGTPSKLLDGDKVEKEFMTMLETGYARRCLFGFNKYLNKRNKLSPEEVYNIMTSQQSTKFLDQLATRLGKLADIHNFNTRLQMSKEVSLELIKYKLDCEERADHLKDHQEIIKAETAHRYYKALKLAGTYAFIDGSTSLTEDHLYNAIKLVEESGAALQDILNREKNWERLAKYIVDRGRKVTHVDIIEDLAFYKGGESQKRELMNLAIAYGYQNNCIIKRTINDGIEFFEGEQLIKTDPDKIIVSYSTDIAKGYKGEQAPFDQLHKVACISGYHYCAHHFIDGHRTKDNALPGFNMVVIDVDKGINLSTAQLLLKDYKAFFATTKRHTEQENRFRIILPLSHVLKLTPENYSKFMENIYNWLPFEVDNQTKDISRKWLSNNGKYFYQDGELLDAMLFIPETKKEEEQTKKIMSYQSLNNLERWFYLNTSSGNRSNQLIKYALILVDNGYSSEGIREAISNFNYKLDDPLTETEISNTIMVTVMKAVTKRDN